MYVIDYKIAGYRIGDTRYPASWEDLGVEYDTKAEAEDVIDEMSTEDDKHPKVFGYDNRSNYRARFVSNN